MTKRFGLVLITLFAVLALALVACGDDDDDDDGGGGGGATSTPTAAGDRIEDDDRPLVIARAMDTLNGDPHRAFCDTCQIYITATYQTLVGLDHTDNSTLIPRVATEWSPSEDLTAWTFKLNPDAVFADGTPLTSEDVKWSLERLANLKGSPSFFMDGVVSIDTPNDHEIVVHMAAPDASFPAKMNAPYTAIVNKDLAEANGATGGEDAETTDAAEQWFLANSAGSGPYVMESFQQGDSLRLVRNENYWGPSPKAAIKTVIIQEVADAVGQRQLLEAGQADIAMQIDPDTARGITSDQVKIESVPSLNFVYVGFVIGTEGAVGSEIDLNQNVRQAIRAAIDYDGMIDVLLGGDGRKQATAIPNGFLGTANLPLPERDLDKARELLAAGGYPDGFEMDAPYWSTNVYGVDFNLMMQKVQADVSEIGVKLNLQPLEASVIFANLGNNEVPFTAIYYAPDHPDTVQYPQYFAMIEGSRWSGRAGGTKGPIVDPVQQDLYERALQTADLEERERLYDELGREMIEDAFILPLANPNLILAYRSDLQGMHYSGCCNLEVGQLYRTSSSTSRLTLPDGNEAVLRREEEVVPAFS